MKIEKLSEQQLRVMSWWCEDSIDKSRDAVVCDGAVRSGKTFVMGISFIAWAFYRFSDSTFAICSKTIRSARRNVVSPILPVLKSLGFEVEDKISSNLLIVSYEGKVNRFYLFGGKDEASASLIQGMTLSGVLLDEVALMPRSFVEQALARCSVSGSKFWFNCNPEYPAHWFYQEWIKKREEKNALYLHFTMKDNPSLSKETKERYERLYTGTFYRRFIKGEWVELEGAVYPFMASEDAFWDVPTAPFEDYCVSCDYGTVNPASFGLWGKKDGVWYRIDEYYYSSRREGAQRTDEEHYEALRKLTLGRRVRCVVVDPSAASFIELIKRRGEFYVMPAKNLVTDGVRQVSVALKEGRVRICKNCKDSVREFSLYRWALRGDDVPVKENDHAMDDIRYFVTTILNRGDDCVVAVAADRRTGCEVVF